jgi:hypothetical protein
MINMEVEMARKIPSRPQDGAYSAEKDFSTGDIEVVRGLRYNMTVLKWLIPVVVTVVLGLGGLFAWLAKRALVAEIRDLVAPVERKIDRLEVRVEGIEKRMDRVEEKKR